MTTITKTVLVDFEATATGDGYWGMVSGQKVRFNKLELEVNWYGDDEDPIAELCAYHNLDAHKYGLCYTDSGIEEAVKAKACEVFAGIVDEYCVGSEQGMQGADYLSCDIGLVKGLTARMIMER
jgi:hypothetical protein